MRSDRIAEWILSVLEAPDRAVPAVGDLLEDAAERGRLWFWLQVTRTALTFLWRNLATAPLRLTGFAVFGWFAYVAVSLILWLGAMILVPLV